MNSSVNIHSLPSSRVWKLSSFFRLWKAVFSTGDIALITDLGLIDIILANLTAELFACILLRLKFSAKTKELFVNHDIIVKNETEVNLQTVFNNILSNPILCETIFL